MEGCAISIDNKKNLILVIDHRRLDWHDFEEIAREIVQVAPDIAVHIVSYRDTAAVLDARKWQRPSVTVSLGPTKNFLPPRGPIRRSQPIPKLDQYERFRAAGISTPRSARFKFGNRYPPEEWSEFVILKPLPLSMTSRIGASRLYRARRLEQLTEAALPVDHPLKQGPALVQSFIDTGPFPSKWRVLTLFGEPLYSSLTRSVAERARLDASDEEIEGSIVDAKNPISIAADTEGARNRLAVDDEIVSFARRIHGAFPRIPVLGTDILRSATDGKLYAIEVNAGGNVWHFSSPKDAFRSRLGGRQAMIDQLGAWKNAATALIRLTHETAT